MNFNYQQHNKHFYLSDWYTPSTDTNALRSGLERPCVKIGGSNLM